MLSQHLDPANANHLAVNFRLLVQLLKKQDFQACCGEHVERTVDDVWQVVDDGNRELQTQVHSSWFTVNFFTMGLQTRTAVARLPLPQQCFLEKKRFFYFSTFLRC